MNTLINSGDTAWMLACTVLVFLLIPGFVLFYGGLGHQINIPEVLIASLLAVCLITLQWVLFGYSLSFGPDHGGWIGNLAWAGLREVGTEPNMAYTGSVPQLVFMLYQGMLAAIPAALLLGACAERMKRSAFMVFILLWTTFVYDPEAHWFWGVSGFLRSSGVIDFAGGAVLHVNAGVSALVISNRLDKRQEHSSDPLPEKNVTYAAFGAVFLLLGFLGLTSGNALSAGGLAANAAVMTQIAAAAAGLTWVILDRILRKRFTTLGVITGMVAGFIAITPCAGFVNLGGALFISMGVSMICYVALAVLKVKFGYDDSINIFALHGVGGAWGVIATGLWATQSVNMNGVNGLFYGNPPQLLIQVKATLATIIYSYLASWGLLKLVDLLIGLERQDGEKSAPADAVL